MHSELAKLGPGLGLGLGLCAFADPSRYDIRDPFQESSGRSFVFFLSRHSIVHLRPSHNSPEHRLLGRSEQLIFPPPTMTTAPLAPEIIWFNPSDSYSDDPTDTLDIVSRTSKGRGLLAVCYGFEEHNPSLGVWVMVWKTLEEHHSFMGFESYTDFALPVMEAMVGPGEITQVLLSQHRDFFRAIASPVTQFINITLRPRHDRNYELTPLVEKLAHELTLVPGCHGSSWGPSVQHDDVYVGIVGWRSLADRDHAVKGSLASTITLIREIGNIQMKYARLQSHEAP
ncbi:hypothetical protein Ac2012v2_005727 [Leucoagaricus gongylophorus]